MTTSGTTNGLRRIDDLLRRSYFYPLAVASLLAMALYLNERLANGWRGPRLHLNLFLAWVPWGMAVAARAVAERYAGRRAAQLQWPLLFGWFIFFPNAPYLLTDFAYLDWTHFDVWQRVAIFCAFAQCGLMLAMTSLLIVRKHVQTLLGSYASKAIVASAILLAGLGVYIGRFLRWNSWDLFSHPLDVAIDAVEKLGEPIQGIRPLQFSIMFTLILATYYYFVATLAATDSDDE